MGYIVAKECPTCGRVVDAEVDTLHGQVVCTECATVLDDQYIDDTQDVRIFEDNQDARRLEKVRPADQSGKPDLSSVRIQGRKGLDKSTESKASERQNGHLNQISQIAAALGGSCSPEIKHRAQDIVKLVMQNAPNPMRGKCGVHQLAIYVAAIYIAARQLNSMLTLAELQLVDTGLSQHHINKACKFIREKLPQIASFEEVQTTRPLQVGPRFESHETVHMQQIEQMSSLLPCSVPVLRQAQYLFGQFMQSSSAPLSGTHRAPIRSIYAACLYVAARQVGKIIFAAEFASTVPGLRAKDIISAWIFLRQKIPAATAIYFRGFNDMQAEAQFQTPTTSTGRAKNFDEHVRAPVKRLCKALKFNFKEKRIAEELGDAVARGAHINKKPASIAAVIVWLCSLLLDRDSKADLEIISRYSVSRFTIRAAYKLLVPYFDSFLQQSFGDPAIWKHKLRLPPTRD